MVLHCFHSPCRLPRAPVRRILQLLDSVFSALRPRRDDYVRTWCMRGHAITRRPCRWCVPVCTCTCVSACVPCVRACVSLSQSLSRCLHVLSILAPLRVLHQEVVSVQQAGTPRTRLSLWQCSDRATHLSTDALPVSGGVVARAASLSLSLSLSLCRPRTLSFSLYAARRDILSRSRPCVLSHSFSLTLIYTASFSAPQLESLSG